MKQDAAAIIRAHTKLAPTAFVPEIRLYQASEITPIWLACEKWMDQTHTQPPFWAFPWPGSLALARYILDNPEVVRGLRVFDFASGDGLAAIAAKKAGAAFVQTAECDLLAQESIRLNAQVNSVQIDVQGAVDLDHALQGFDLILAGDVCYEKTMSQQVLRWLSLSAKNGAQVWLADPHRSYAPHPEDSQLGLTKRARYDVPVSRELEDRDVRTVTIWQVSSLGDQA